MSLGSYLMILRATCWTVAAVSPLPLLMKEEEEEEEDEEDEEDDDEIDMVRRTLAALFESRVRLRSKSLCKKPNSSEEEEELLPLLPSCS